MGSAEKWSRLKRRRFIDEFVATGDPMAAALAAGHTMIEAFRQREVDAAFAADWDWAIRLAWHRARLRVLAGLAGQSGAGGPIDPRITLAMLRGAQIEEVETAAEAPEPRRLKGAAAD